jgi:hypothetical protein
LLNLVKVSVARSPDPESLAYKVEVSHQATSKARGMSEDDETVADASSACPRAAGHDGLQSDTTLSEVATLVEQE